MCTPSVSNVIYHKFSHGAAFCTLNVKNVNVMLEFVIKQLRLSLQTIKHKAFYKLKYKKYEMKIEMPQQNTKTNKAIPFSGTIEVKLKWLTPESI